MKKGILEKEAFKLLTEQDESGQPRKDKDIQAELTKRWQEMGGEGEVTQGNIYYWKRKMKEGKEPVDTANISADRKAEIKNNTRIIQDALIQPDRILNPIASKFGEGFTPRPHQHWRNASMICTILETEIQARAFLNTSVNNTDHQYSPCLPYTIQELSQLYKIWHDTVKHYETIYEIGIEKIETEEMTPEQIKAFWDELPMETQQHFLKTDPTIKAIVGETD